MKQKVFLFLNKKTVAGSLFILPWVAGFFVFTAFPFLFSLFLSFTQYDMLSPPSWVGFANYVEMFLHDTEFRTVLGVTFRMVFISVPLRLIVSLLIALLLAKPRKASGLYRTLLYLPSLVGGSVAVSIVWRNIFAVDGLVNGFLANIGLPNDINWLGNPSTALIPIILLLTWQFGSSMLIFVAGLKNIPISYYEAARVDGAGAFRVFFSITLPLISPLILFNLVMQTISGFLVFTPSYLISNGTGGPLNSTKVYAMYLFQKGIEEGEMGYASAMAWVMVVLISLITVFILKSSKRWVFYQTNED